MPDASLFHGVAVIIDDDFKHEEDAQIKKIREQISDEGCHVISFPDLPDEKQCGNFRAASFFILDWDLHSEPGVTLPASLKAANIAATIEFLQKLKAIRFAPVFIFTAANVDEVINELKKHTDIYSTDNPLIFVKNKGEVLTEGVFNVLKGWLERTPSAYVLKEWEREYEKAKNDLFIDFCNSSVDWPLYLWETFKGDGTVPSTELGRLIGSNLVARMTPFEFKLEEFSDRIAQINSDGSYADTLRHVLQGERFLYKDRLHDDHLSPGDVFSDGDLRVERNAKHVTAPKKVFLNVRPECDCIARDDLAMDEIEMYLIPGKRMSQGEVAKFYRKQYGNLEETDMDEKIFAMYDGYSYRFSFREMQIVKWGKFKDQRFGRLLPPFSTRIQQRYAAFLQRPGMPRIPASAVDPVKNEEQGSDDLGQTVKLPKGSKRHFFLCDVLRRIRSGTLEIFQVRNKRG